MVQWTDRDQNFIRKRYDRIGKLISLSDWLLFVPPEFRRRAAMRLNLRAGDRVMEIGCGTGLNLPHLRDAVGAAGRVYGVDLSSGMLQHARTLVDRSGWRNVSLVQSDAGEYRAPEPLDGIL